MELSKNELLNSAGSVGFESGEIKRIEELINRFNNAKQLKDIFFKIFALLENDSDPLEKIKVLDIEKEIGVEYTRALYLLVCLNQVPPALKRRAQFGISEEISRKAFSDIALWTRTHQEFKEPFGFDYDIIEWSQTYLKDNLIRIKNFNFRLFEFPYPIFVYRNKVTNKLKAYCKEDGGKYTFDLTKGTKTDSLWKTPSHDWYLVLKPYDLLVRSHFPSDAQMEFAVFLKETKEAIKFYEKIGTSKPILGICGESWLFDYQIANLLKNPMLLKLISIGSFYPSIITENNTIRRLFGPGFKRHDVLSLPRKNMNSLLKFMVTFLSNPDNKLISRGGFILKDELNKQKDYLKA